MRLGTVCPDRLALALPHPQRVDHARAEEEDDEGGGEERRTGPERDISKKIEDLQMIREFHKPQKHQSVPR
jgi:hypothetical protein